MGLEGVDLHGKKGSVNGSQRIKYGVMLKPGLSRWAKNKKAGYASGPG